MAHEPAWQFKKGKGVLIPVQLSDPSDRALVDMVVHITWPEGTPNWGCRDARYTDQDRRTSIVNHTSTDNVEDYLKSLLPPEPKSQLKLPITSASRVMEAAETAATPRPAAMAPKERLQNKVVGRDQHLVQQVCAAYNANQITPDKIKIDLKGLLQEGQVSGWIAQKVAGRGA